MYYSLLAVLFRVGIKSENHTASIILLNKLFDLKVDLILRAKEERINKQYYVDFKVVEKDVKELIRVAEEFNDALFNFLGKINLELINIVRKKFKIITD